jgi:glucan biosynthesis protein C
MQPLADPRRVAFAATYTLALWCWRFAAIGAALKFLDKPSPHVRYLSDASYWMYLVHPPIVCLLQAWMLRWPLHWPVKFSLVIVATTALLLASYHWLVRGTFVGVLLNGRRHPKSNVIVWPRRGRVQIRSR